MTGAIFTALLLMSSINVSEPGKKSGSDTVTYSTGNKVVKEKQIQDALKKEKSRMIEGSGQLVSDQKPQPSKQLPKGKPGRTKVPLNVGVAQGHPAEPLYNADSAVKFATGDILTIPHTHQPYIRYLSLYNIPKADRRKMAALVSFVCNSLGTRRKIYIPEFVGASDETLIRINILDYEWNPEAWENLAEKGSGPKASPEPYFHIFVEEPKFIKKKFKRPVKKTVKKPVKRKVKKQKQVPYRDSWGRTRYRTEEVEEEVTDYVDEEVTEFVEVEEVVHSGNKRTILVAPWLDKVGIKTLIEKTGSKSPIMRADWFISNVVLAPAYYEFLRLGNNIKDFENLIFADEELAKKARSQDKGVVVTSMVTRNNRTLTRSPTFTNGYYWKSHDSLTSVDDRNYVLNPLNEEFDATEDIGTLPNGLQAYFLTDGQGNRINDADPNVAVDKGAVDSIVRTARSCMICHSDGIRHINDEIRALTKAFKNRESIKLWVTQEKDYYEIEDLFGFDLDERVTKDQNIYRNAVAKATGLSSQEIARLLSQTYDGYVEHLLTKNVICREVGLPINKLEEYIRMSSDPLVLGLIKNPIRPIRRDQWERSYQKLMLLIMAAKQGGRPVIDPSGTKLVPLK